MDSEPGPVPEDNNILGKRKRSPRNDLAGSGADTATQSATDFAQDVLPTAQNLDSKKLRLHPFALFGQKHEQCSPVRSFNDLPVEIIQHVFTFLDPFSLGRLLCIQRSFQALIDPRRPLPPASGLCGKLSLLPQELLWSFARQNFIPRSPPPMETLSEYQMLKLIYGRACQFCGRSPKSRPTVTPLSPWNMGPGPDGVRIVWPFKVRSCADCLGSYLLKEQDLELSTASIMQPGLAPAYFTNSLHYVASATLRHYSVPAKLQLTKYYFRQQVEGLQDQANQIRAAAPAAFNQWYRGLVPSLDAFLSDVARLEQWEASIRETNLSETIPFDASSVSSYSAYSGPQASSVAPSFLTSTSHTTWHHARNASTNKANNNTPINYHIPQLYPTSGSGSLSHQRRPFAANASRISERTPQDALRTKNERRLEIERRSQLLDPPIPLPELGKMKSFKAAILIARPLDNGEWDRLQARLLAERADLGAVAPVDLGSSSSHFPTRETVIAEATVGEEGEFSSLIDRAHRSTRDKLSEIGSAFVKRCWIGGANITEESAPRFAVDVLEHVSRRFFELQEQEDAALSLQGHPPPADSESGMRTRTLQLRHMRHVFDTCVRPYTDLTLKELFFCSGCEIPEKRFAFNALIQHFAAKHTSDFSQGIHVVHWRSEWPRVPPYRVSSDRVDQVVPGLTGHVPEAAAMKDSVPVRITTDGQQMSFDNAEHRRAVMNWSSIVATSDQPTSVNPGLRVQDPGVSNFAAPGMPQGFDLPSSQAVESASVAYEVARYPYGQTRRRPSLPLQTPRGDTNVASRPDHPIVDPHTINRSMPQMLDESRQEPSGHRQHYHSTGYSEAHPDYQRSYSPRDTYNIEQQEVHSTRSSSMMRSFPRAQIPATRLQSRERAVDDFLNSFPSLTAEGNGEKMDIVAPRSASRGAVNIAAVSMDRRSNISQPRKPSYDINPSIRRQSVDTRDGFMNIDPPPQVPMSPRYEGDSRPLVQHGAPAYRDAHLYDDQDHQYPYLRSSVVGSNPYHRYPDHGQQHTYVYDHSEGPHYRRTGYHSPDRGDAEIRYQNVTPTRPVQIVRERFWDRETQSYVWFERDYEPRSSRRYVPETYGRGSDFDRRHARVELEGVSPSRESTYRAHGPVSTPGPRALPSGNHAYHHPRDIQRGRDRDR